MKTTVLIAGLLIAGNALAMTEFPAGNYHGKGHAVHQNGVEERYLVESKVTGNSIQTTYHVNGETLNYALQASFEKNGFFDVKMDGAKVGSGYCMSVWCHYSIRIGDFSLEETLTFFQEHLYRLGQKTIDGKIISWEDDTERQ